MPTPSREAGLDEETAHWEAIAAMDEYGRYIASQGIPATDRLAVPDRTVVLLPARVLREWDPLPHSWDVTSDIVAAWVAFSLCLDLLLLKSVEGIVTAGVLQKHVDTQVVTDVTDPLFIPYVLNNRVDTFIINGSHPELLRRYLSGDPVPGTRISTTF